MGQGASGRGRLKATVEGFIFPFGSLGSKIHAVVFIRHRYASLAAALAAYAATLLAFGGALEVSANYFVILPVIVAALGFGMPGGLVSGALGLPANLLIFALLGHLEFSPASKLIAELSGIAVGLTFGGLAEYFRDVEREIRKRMATEAALRSALGEKELLLRELHHRVKNNLSVIKGLIQLQRNRSGDPSFVAASDELIGRIFAISLAHDQLGQDQSLESVDPAAYVRALAYNLAGGLGMDESLIEVEIEGGTRAIDMEAAISLGLIVNEVLTNAFKHASPIGKGGPAVRLSFRVEGDDYSLVVCDDGPGPARPWREASGSLAQGGLGLKLVESLARNLGGTATLEAIPRADGGTPGIAGARFALRFPLSSAGGAGPAD